VIRKATDQEDKPGVLCLSDRKTDELHVQVHDAFFASNSSPYLFFWNTQTFSLLDLQHFLDLHSFQTILLNGTLNFDNRIFFSVK
jgi:hypothetical protein